jgi:hypothetical protein
MANCTTVSTTTSAFYIMNRSSDEEGMSDRHLGKVECRGWLKLKAQKSTPQNIIANFFEPRI